MQLQKPATVLQQPVTAEQLLAICARAFGSTHPIIAIHELGGGTINTAYRITLHNHPSVIVRVAPSETHPHLFRHEHGLLRREYGVQPFLAPIGHLLPTLYLADFTHQIIARDILIQAVIPGELWRDVQEALSQTEATALWRQLGHITRQIHLVQHHAFGPSAPVPRFQRWSDSLLVDFQNIQQDMDTWSLPSQSVQRVIDYLGHERAAFDRIQTPHLLHGDLWLNNLLIHHSNTHTEIRGVLDAGFAQWGDPAADWTLMRMSLAPPPGAEAFWEGYGRLSQDAEEARRTPIYQARALGWSILELHRRQHPESAKLWPILENITGNLR